tara:strand:- start:195 stop:452 length:258 start_codon:yes stop_codon:yes gene_type:complete
MISIKEINNDKFEVCVKLDTETKHIVKFDNKYYARFTKKKSKKEILKDSFEFLLERELNTEIFSSFDLSIINYYFPEYEKQFYLK